MLNVIMTGLVAFIITFLAIPAIMKVADEKRLFDLPDARKLHTRPIASLGGVGIFIGFLLSLLLLSSGKENAEFQYFFAASIVIFFLGLKDDILILSPTKKFLGQVAAAAIIVHLGHLQLDSLYGFMGIHDLPAPLGILFSYMTVIVVINAFNLIDGVDGLSGSLGLLTASLFGIYFLVNGLSAYAAISFALAGSLVAFLCFNAPPAKIFMGDSGSLLLGLVNAILVMKFINIAGSGTAAVALPLSSAGAIGFSILIVPLLDTVRVFSTRIAKGRSPFVPDRNHIHHLLLDRGLNPRAVTLSCVGLNAAFVAMAYLGRNLGSTILIVSMVATFYLLVGALVLWKKPVVRLVIRSFNITEAKRPTTTKVVPITKEATAVEQ
jgi:UDP-GlcNAc:undecaprenyl-phosphate/decaprenyl-phosphate GlcNAc-1-phosphate transferase